MEALKKITHNCKHATLLIEKKLVERLTLRERISLKIHLAGCDWCKLYQKQTARINEMIHRLFISRTSEYARLDDSFKKELQDRIEDELNKS